MDADTGVMNKLDHPEVLRVLFHPRQDTHTAPPSANLSEELVTVADGVAISGRFHVTENARATILFFHGNGETSGDYDQVAQFYLEKKINFLAVDYRGYGKSGGAPTASSLLRDAHVLLKYVTSWMEQRSITGPLVVMGRSLGAAPAIECAASYRDQVKGLIIESGFADSLPVLRTLGVDLAAVGLAETEGFGNAAKIRAVTAPTLILHGQYDRIVSLENGEGLQRESGAKIKQFFIIPGADHNSMLQMGGATYFETISRFIDKVVGGPVRRKRQNRREP